MILHLAYLSVVINATLITPVLEFTVIGSRSLVAEYCRIGNSHEHIIVLLQEGFHCTCQRTIEESEVESHVVVLDAFPLTRGRSKLAIGLDGSKLVAAYIGSGQCTEVIELIAIIIVDATLRTHLGIRSTKFQIAQPFHIFQEILLVDAPSQRCAPEECPTVLWQELGTTVVTAIELQEILTVEVVVETTEVRHDGIAIVVLEDVIVGQGQRTITIDNIETFQDVGVVGTKHLHILQFILGAESETCIMQLGKSLVSIYKTRDTIEVGAGRSLLKVRLSLRRIFQGLAGTCIIIIGDAVLDGAAASLVGIVAYVDIGIQPVGKLSLQSFADAEGTNRELVVATLLQLSHRRSPGTPGVSLSILRSQWQAWHRHAGSQGRTYQCRSHLFLSTIGDAALKSKHLVELVGIVPADIVSLIVVAAILER